MTLTPRGLLKGLVMIATLAAIGWLVQATGLSNALDTGWIDTNIRGHGVTGQVVFVAVAALATAIAVPRQLVAFLGGYAFGLGTGTALALVASVLGCLAGFGYARLIGRGFVMARFSKRIRRLETFLSDRTFTTALLIRLLPVGNNAITNLLAGVSSVRLVPFLLGSAVGYVPQTVIFVLLGSGVRLDPGLRTGLSAALFVLSGLLGVTLVRRFRGALADEGDLAESE